jgi:protein TonB
MKARTNRYPTLLLCVLLAIFALPSSGHAQPPATNPDAPQYDTAPILLHQAPDPSIQLELLVLSAAEAQRVTDPGTAIVVAVIDLHGNPQNVHLLRGIGMGRDIKAIEAVKFARFKPAMKDGAPVPTSVNIKVTFLPPDK